MSDEDVELQSWGWTDLSSYYSSLLDSETEQQLVSVPQTRIMSRVSLRLDDGLLDRSLPHSSASFSVGGASWKTSRSLKSRRSHHLSVSCSESLLVPSPLPPRQRSSHVLHNTGVPSVASDASLLSSLLDESSVQDVTLVDAMWGKNCDSAFIVSETSDSRWSSSTGLDHDLHPKESTILANSTLIGSDMHAVPNPIQTLNRVYCTDCELEPVPKHAPASSASKHASAALTGTGSCDRGESEVPVIYHREQSRRPKIGAMVSVWEAGVGVSRWAAACFMSLLALIHVQMQKRHHVTDVLQLCARRVLTHTWQVCLRFTSDRRGGNDWAGPAHCGTMKPQKCHAGASLWRTLCEAFRCFGRRWCQITAPDSAPLLPRLFVVLLLLLLLLSLYWFSPVGLQSLLAVLNVTRTQTSQSPSAEGAVEEPPLHSRPMPSGEDDPERLVGLEQSLASLWEHFETRGQWAEQRHGEVLRLFADLQRQVSVAQSGEEEDLRAWISSVRRSLDEERQVEHQKATSRLDRLEQQLLTLAAQTEELQRREAVTSSPPDGSIDADHPSNNALLVEVERLEAALKEMRHNVDGLTAFKDDCLQFNAIQQTISARVHDEVRTLIYGNQLAAVGMADAKPLPESLLQWLSQRYVSSADLQVALSSVELSVLQNMDLRLEQRRGEEAVAGTDLRTATAITKEDVHAIVTSALRRFSQDQTGLADYALESGGGSILSTRCSETYETKAALLSLFGVPLWYFSQSPRAVIQPDIQPGNCWAFQGSSGFLVIRLSMRIVPTAFSLDHIPKVLAPSGTLRSAPRDFSVYGLDDERQESGKLLGVYTYDPDGDALQTYATTEENHQSFQIIEVRVLSNWGHEDYTCMYRFRVHGTPEGRLSD
uniref:SUN domain-containing protein 1-like isoform X3 n=1 Tax=Solea senegalensis TaxID=28829 RepID=UPI001CD8F53E|nr:SUN domain-containing protein 1-like isoform X3 [Solea senegalensis]